MLANLSGLIVPLIILEASISAEETRILKLSMLLDDVLTVLTKVTFCISNVPIPDPTVVRSLALTVDPFIELNASCLTSCNVNALVVTDPTK